MVAPVSLLPACVVTPWISTKLSSVRRCKCINVFEVRTGNENYFLVLCRIPQISVGKQILLYAQSQDSYAKKYYLSFAQSTVKIRRLQDLLTATQDVSDTVKFSKTPQKSLQWELMDAWFTEDWILLPPHYPGSLQVLSVPLVLLGNKSLSQLHFPLLCL